MTAACLVALIVAAPAPVYREDFGTDVFILDLARAVRCKQALHPKIGETRLLSCWLLFLDTRPAKDFQTFAGEKLDLSLLKYSAGWTGRFFRDIANPHPNQVFPSGYFLSTQQGVSSLLQYEWSGGGYTFVMQESRRAVLLRVRPDRVRFSPKDGIAAGQALSILGDVLSKEVADLGDMDKQFRPPIRMMPGSYASNAAHRFLGSPMIFDWRKQILVFVTETDFCILLFRADKDARTGKLGLDEKDWLPSRLVTRGGKSLLIDEIRDTKPRRAVPEKTIKLPR